MRARLDLSDGQIAAIAAVQTFGDYLGFHPHIHILAATGLIDEESHFHLLPVENIDALTELFRHLFMDTLLREKLISQKKARDLQCEKNLEFGKICSCSWKGTWNL